ncbi:MAG TPA: hypothetical protein VKB69_15800 [Micromonosporaceae bacterium]|nr:hypothetical protein [Micromonosporaceae bacterium]
MALVRSFEDHDYRPEYGTFLVRDTDRPPARHPLSPALAERGTHIIGLGSVALAGDGWIAAHSPDAGHRVTLELHDELPVADEPPEWTDVVESPFGCGGAVGLAMVTGNDPADTFRLAGPGLYRVRFASRPDGTSGRLHYRLLMWRVDAPEPPRWLRRHAPLAPPANRWDPAVGDLAQTMLWAREAALDTPTGWLAKRLDTTSEAVEQAMRHVEAAGVLRDPRPRPAQRHTGIPANIRELAGQPRPPRESPTAAPARLAAALPMGQPLRTGVVTRQGNVMVWRPGGGPTFATVRPNPRRAVETPNGIVVLGGEEAILVRPDGELALLGSHLHPTIGVTGEGRVAMVEQESRVGRTRLLFVDPGTGARSVHVCGGPVSVTGAHSDTVHLRGAANRPLVWRPGAEPELYPYQVVDVRRDGTLLAHRDGVSMLIRPDGTVREVPVPGHARLSPAADLLYWFRFQQALVLVPADRPGAEPVEVPLLPRAQVSSVTPTGPAWEDDTHLVVPIDGPPAAVRVDVEDRSVRMVPVPPEAGRRFTLIGRC